MSSMSGHQGVAFQNEARQIILQDCWAGSANSAFSWRQNRAKLMSAHSPDHRNLRFADPLAMGLTSSYSYYTFGEDMRGRYGHDQAQIPHFNDNSCHDCEEGFVVAHRNQLDSFDVAPMLSSGIKFHARAPYLIPEYSFNYFFKDFFFKGDGSGTAIWIGTKCYNFTFANSRVSDFANLIRDEEFNYLGFLVDIAHNCPNVQSSVSKNIGSASIAAHPQSNIMGAWTQTGTAGDGNVLAHLRSYELLDSATQLPSSLPTASYNPGVASGTTIPRFELDADAGGTVTPNGRGGIRVHGIITDRIGNRNWPSFQRFQIDDADPVADRVNDTIKGTDLVERNGCWNDAGTWRSTLWFVDFDRLDHTPIHIPVDVTLSGFDPAFLALHEVAGADATKPVHPLPVEDLSYSSIRTEETSVAPFSLLPASDVAPGALVVCPSAVVVARVSNGLEVNATITGGEMRVNSGAWTAGPALVQRGDSVEVRATASPVGGGQVSTTLTIGSQAAEFVVTTANAITSISDDFEAYADGSALEDQAKYQLALGPGGALTINGGALSTISQADYVQHLDDLGRVDGLVFKARWNSEGGARFGLYDPANPTSNDKFRMWKRWDSTFRINAFGITWIYPNPLSQEVAVSLSGGSWSVTFDGVATAPTSGGAETLPQALGAGLRVMIECPSGNGTRSNTLQEFSVTHL